MTPNQEDLREIDKKIAEKLGFTEVSGPDSRGRLHGCFPDHLRGDIRYLPQWSTDLNAAIELLISLGDWWQLMWVPTGKYWCLSNIKSQQDYTAETAALAICLAFLGEDK